MKKLIGLIALTVMLICMLISCAHTHNFEGEWEIIKEATATENGIKARYCYCGEKQSEVIYYNGTDESEKSDIIAVEEGYLVVNGIKTEYKVHTEPVISVIDGYVAVNGIKTEYKVDDGKEPEVKEDEITISDDGYLVVNGVKTEYKVHTEPVISVIDGYIAVNGVKTEYLVATQCNHIWNTVTTEPTCTAGGYDTMTCPLCDKIVKVNETDPLPHAYQTTYTIDNNYHWFKCNDCDSIKDKDLHNLDDEGVCTVCLLPVSSTPGVIYDISTDGTYAEVIGYEGTSDKVKIAEEYNGLPVKSIYSNSFKYNKNIKSIIIPDSVITIENCAFDSCSSLSSVVIGNGVTIIGEKAFYSCRLLASIVVGNSVTSIGKEAFFGCTALTSFIMPDSVTSIGRSAFSSCSNLSFREYGNCTYLESENNPHFALIGTTNSNYTNYEIHQDTKVIIEQAFDSHSRLTSIIIPDGIKHIEHATFSHCTALTSVIIGNNVTSIGHAAFYSCSSLTSVIIPDGVIFIDEVAFYGCNSLTNVVIPNSVKSIGRSAFASCTTLTKIFYTGSDEEWEKVNKGGEYDFSYATIHFNYVPEEN